MNPSSPEPHKTVDPPEVRATYVLDREGRIIETNEMLVGLSFCQHTGRPGTLFSQRVDPDSAGILNAFFKDPGETLAGKVDFCFMRGDAYFFPTRLSIQALCDAGAVVGFVVHVQPAGDSARPKARAGKRPVRSKP